MSPGHVNDTKLSKHGSSPCNAAAAQQSKSLFLAWLYRKTCLSAAKEGKSGCRLRALWAGGRRRDMSAAIFEKTAYSKPRSAPSCSWTGLTVVPHLRGRPGMAHSAPRMLAYRYPLWAALWPGLGHTRRLRGQASGSMMWGWGP